ncbi:unnamed protein product [Symbiodinium natans]|uniref:Uncharacterized protein n=1 Tax=Symbiodinium natans TaxID=878477 RepID=A0A812S4Y4_9DINO|nr:unnamed protein product [Symbiodinium natans]
MGKRYNPFPDPKKGKGRMVLKKPAGVKSASWSKVPYQRHKLGGGFLRKDQTKWRRNIQQLLKATDNQILDMLMKDKFLQNWEGCVCPFCNKGVLGPLSDRPSRDTKAYRCNKKNCQKYVSPAHLHPLFTVLRGPEGHSLQVQATALLLRLAGVPLATIHLLTNINHKAIERLNSNLNFLRSGHVTQVEKTIKFGGAPKAWRDVEVDEACFDKRTLKPWEQTKKDAQQGKNTEWEQWGGLVQRGCPKSLVLFKLRPAITVPRAPGPGAIRKVDWTTWELDAVSKACKRCDGRSVLQRGRSSTETWECLANIRWSWFQARRCSYARSSDPSLADPLALRLGDNASHVLIQELACAYPQILVAVPVLVLCTTDLGCQLLGGCLAMLV